MEKERDLELVLICPFCGDEHTVEINFEDFLDYQNGDGLAQEIFDYLTPTEREQIISHICPACQDLVFGGGEE